MTDYVPQPEPTRTATPLNPPVKPQHFGKTQRARDIAKFVAYFKGTQYDGRPNWWTGVAKQGDEPVPLRERKPCIIYPLPKASVQQAVRFTFGEGKFPEIRVAEVKPEDALTGMAVSKDNAAILQSYISDIVEQARLKPRMRTLMRNGLHARTAVAILTVREGRFEVQVARAQDCWPLFRNDDPNSDIVGLTWCYEFDKLGQDEKGEPKTTRCYFRRDISETHDIAFIPPEVKPGVDPVWTIDMARTREHGLGCCPVVWIRNLEEDGCAGELDGVSLFEGLFDEFDSLNLALSQRHKGIHYQGSPQPFETGVEDDDGPAAEGRKGGGGGYSPAQGGEPDAFAVEGSAARKTGPDRVQSYRSDKVKVGLIETSGKPFEAATNHVNDIRQRALEAMGVMIVDAEKVAGKGDMSAKFLALAYAPFLGLVDELRDCWWPAGLRPLISLALRITVSLKGQGLLLPRADKVAGILRSHLVKFEDREVWITPKMLPAWGDYFSASNDEILTGTQAAALAIDKRVVTGKSATGFIGSYYGVADVDAEREQVEAEAASAAQSALELAQATKAPPGDPKNPAAKAATNEPTEKTTPQE
jgi:hypothetical protein